MRAGDRQLARWAVRVSAGRDPDPAEVEPAAEAIARQPEEAGGGGIGVRRVDGGDQRLDGDCAFCTSCVRWLERWVRPDADIVAWQLADLDALGVGEEQAADAVQWVEPGGAVLSGHEAVAAVLSSGRPAWRLAGRVLVLPGVSRLTARAYRAVAANRHRLPGGTPACRR